MGQGTPHRTIRIDDALWDAAQAKARERKESVSDVIRRALELYADDRHVQPSDPFEPWTIAHVANCPECTARFGGLNLYRKEA